MKNHEGKEGKDEEVKQHLHLRSLSIRQMDRSGAEWKELGVNDDDRETSTSERDPASTFSWSALLRICAIGFFFNCQPSEPFLTRYLKEDKGISEHELDDYVWPFDTYGSFLFLIPAGILAESLGYRPTIFIGLVLREMTRLILLFAPGVYWAAFMQLTYAGATSINFVYYAYVYMVFDRADFPFATAFVHASYHVGNVLGSVFGQVLVDYTSVGENLKILFYLSWAFTTISVGVFFLLPRPRNAPPASLAAVLRRSGVRHTLDMVSGLYRDDAVLIWSCWWIFGLIAHAIVSNYYQNQFYAIDPRGKFGYAEAVMELFSAAGAAAAPFAMRSIGGRTLDVATIATLSLVTAVSCLVSTLWTESIWISYVCNTVVLTTYSALSSLACTTIPVHVRGVARRYALIFTTNSFVALAVATILLESGSALKWTTNEFYYVAAGSNAILILLALPTMLILLASRKRRRTKTTTRRASSSSLSPLGEYTEATYSRVDAETSVILDRR